MKTLLPPSAGWPSLAFGEATTGAEGGCIPHGGQHDTD